jgi:hypothetical protein
MSFNSNTLMTPEFTYFSYCDFWESTGSFITCCHQFFGRVINLLFLKFLLLFVKDGKQQGTQVFTKRNRSFDMLLNNTLNPKTINLEHYQNMVLQKGVY